jgi:hypothetical protein
MPNKPIDHFSIVDYYFSFILGVLLILGLLGAYLSSKDKKETIVITGLNKLVDPVKGICNYKAITLDGKPVTLDTTCCMFGFNDTITVDKKILK